MRTYATIIAVLGGVAFGATAARADQPKLDAHAIIVGGVGVETLQNPVDDTSEGRSTTIALSRLTFGGQVSDGVSVESEFEVNAGPHGTSVWEGQAALQVRNQLLRIVRGGVWVDVGRITDDSSLDFFSAHVADQLLTDPFTRLPLLASGFNRGNGVLARYEVLDGLHPGIAFNAANPTSTTSSIVLGGTFPPFSRFYFAPYQHVGRDASSLPADTYHIMVLTPSVLYADGRIDAFAAVQMFRVNTDTSTSDDQNILGYNVRGGVRAHLLEDKLQPFFNLSRVTNGVVMENNGKMIDTDPYVGATFSAGIDYNFLGNNGVGIQYSLLGGQQGMISRETQHFVNVGGTYWLNTTTSVGARASLWTSCVVSPENLECDREGMRSYFVTARSTF